MSGATRRTLDTILDAMLDAFPSHGRDLGLAGTRDPGYFSCTLGKLEILALRDRVGGDLRRFHDRLLPA